MAYREPLICANSEPESLNGIQLAEEDFYRRE